MHQGRKYISEWDTPKQAAAWIARTRRDLALGIHEDSEATDPATGKPAAPLFADYAAQWLATRRIKGRPLKPGTRALYTALLADHIAPEFGKRRLDRITPTQVRNWHKTLLPDAPTRRAHAYSLLRTILNSAVDEELIGANPCRVKGAGATARAGRTDLPTLAQLDALTTAMPGPKYQTMTLLAAWCGLRFGELVELRRKDVAFDADGAPVTIKVRRAVYRGVVDTPKSAAGVRDIAVPPHIRPQVSAWLATRPKAGDALLFPATKTGGHIRPSSLYRVFYAARDEVGLPSLRWHDLRHFSATAAAQTGASLAELQRRLGHSTVNAAMRYQHAVQGRDAEIAAAMSALAAPVGNVVPIRPRQQDAERVPEQHWSLTEVRRQLQLANARQLRELINRGDITTTMVRGREMVPESALVAFERMRQAEEAHLLG
jgi:integrase